MDVTGMCAGIRIMIAFSLSHLFHTDSSIYISPRIAAPYVHHVIYTIRSYLLASLHFHLSSGAQKIGLIA